MRRVLSFYVTLVTTERWSCVRPLRAGYAGHRRFVPDVCVDKESRDLIQIKLEVRADRSFRTPCVGRWPRIRTILWLDYGCKDEWVDRPLNAVNLSGYLSSTARFPGSLGFQRTVVRELRSVVRGIRVPLVNCMVPWFNSCIDESMSPSPKCITRPLVGSMNHQVFSRQYSSYVQREC